MLTSGVFWSMGSWFGIFSVQIDKGFKAMNWQTKMVHMVPEINLDFSLKESM